MKKLIVLAVLAFALAAGAAVTLTVTPQSAVARLHQPELLIQEFNRLNFEQVECGASPRGWARGHYPGTPVTIYCTFCRIGPPSGPLCSCLSVWTRYCLPSQICMATECSADRHCRRLNATRPSSRPFSR